MPRIARMYVKGSDAAYQIISRTALDGFVLGDVEKEQLPKIFKWMSAVYFVAVAGFCIMDNHFHLLLRMMDQKDYSNNDIRGRLKVYYADNSIVFPLSRLQYKGSRGRLLGFQFKKALPGKSD